MANRKRTPKHDPMHDVYVLQEGDEEQPEDDDATIIETQVDMDWIEYDVEEEEDHPRKRGLCRLSFHVDLPEHIAQHLFAHHVKDGKLTVEFHPTSPLARQRDGLVRN